MLTRIEIGGFKTFRDFSVDLLPFQVILGPNAVGKSNLPRLVLPLLVCAAPVLFLPGCRPEESNRGDDRPPVAEKPEVELLVFPDELRVADESVNSFMTRAMETCAAGDYNAFRLLWSAREEPLTAREFEEGWEAVREIRVRALERVLLAPEPDHAEARPEVVYAAWAAVEFDPAHRAGQVEARREVILMLVREHDEWRLARAPQAMRVWMRDHPPGTTPDPDEPQRPTTANAGSG